MSDSGRRLMQGMAHWIDSHTQMKSRRAITMKNKKSYVNALFLLASIVIFNSSSLALERDPGNRADTLANLSQRTNVGRGIPAALATAEQVRVYVGLVPMGAKPDSPGIMSISTDDSRRHIATARETILAAVPVGSFQLLRQFQNVPGFAGMASAQAVAAMSQHPDVWRIDLDEGGSGDSLEAQPLVLIDHMKTKGLQGLGITVAVVDSGYDSDHPDLEDSLVGEQCFCSGGPCCPNNQASQSGTGAAEDDHGHGTNVAGIITSNGGVAPEGSAPKADIVAVKVLDANNSFCCSSDVIAALDWIISERPDVDVVNMSLGTNARFQGNCDGAISWIAGYATAINILSANGVPVVVSSGNNGSGVDMQVPACIKNAISVGAVWDSNVGSVTALGCTDATTQADQVTCFSNSSATTDIFAPGAPYTSTGRGGGISTFYGTSQAAPTVAACLALLKEEMPGMSVAELESALKGSPDKVTDSTNNLTFPRLNCLKSVRRIFANGYE